MQRFSAGSRWAIVIGLFLAVKFWRPVLEVIHPSLSIALGFAYLLFVFWGWLAPGIGSFIVLTDRSARHALKFDEKREAVFVGGAFFMGIVFLVGTIAVSPAILLPIVFGCLASSIPFSMTFTNKSRFGRVLFGSIGTITCVLGFATGFAGLFVAGDLLYPFLGAGLLACLLCTWLGNIEKFNMR